GGLTARYQLAQCYRHLANQEYQYIGSNSQLPKAQQHYQQQYRDCLERAADQYRKVVAELASVESEGKLPPNDQAMLLQARFAVADCESSLGHFAKAAPLYDELARRYTGRVEGLIALKQLWRCHSMDGRIDHARTTLVLFSKALTEL